MIGKTIGMSRGKHVVAQRESLRVFPIVRNVLLLHLGVSDELVKLVSPDLEVEAVHLAAVNPQFRTKQRVAKILRRGIRGVPQGYGLAVGDRGRARAIGSGKQAEIV